MTESSQANPDQPKSELDVKSDSEWKQRVKAEAAELDARQQSDAASEETDTTSPSDEPAPGSPGETGDSDSVAVEPTEFDPSQLPPADFQTLVSMFSTQAMVALGVIPNPTTGTPEQNLLLARHFIDMLSVLQEKTRRNLTGHESNLLEQSLHELRMAFLELSKSDASPPK